MRPCWAEKYKYAKANSEKGAISGPAYSLAPRSIIHSWVEVWFEEQWANLEGFVLKSVQKKFSAIEGVSGGAVAIPNLKNPPIEWKGTDTYIQKDSINHDYGVFDDPDAFYEMHGAQLERH